MKIITQLSVLSTLFASVVIVLVYFSGAQYFKELVSTSQPTDATSIGASLPLPIIAKSDDEARHTIAAFFDALSSADVQRTEESIVPEKRGAAAAAGIMSFHSRLASKLRVAEITPLGNSLFKVLFDYTTIDNRACAGLATVFLTKRGSAYLIEQMNTKDTCAL